MRTLVLALTILVYGSALAGPTRADGPSIRVPDSPAPPPAPQPAPADVVQDLPAEVWYVIDSDVELLVLTSPRGFLEVEAASGPQTLKGRFIDAPNKVQTRKFSGKYLYYITAAATGRSELLVVPVGASKESQVIRRLIDALAGPRPPPVPPIPPVPPVPPGPTPVAGLTVLIVYESADIAKLTSGQLNVLCGKMVRDWFDAHTPLGPDGKTHQWRIYDKDVDASAEAKVWQDWLKRPRASVPWIVLGSADSKVAFEGPLPANVADALKLLAQYGGN